LTRNLKWLFFYTAGDHYSDNYHTMENNQVLSSLKSGFEILRKLL